MADQHTVIYDSGPFPLLFRVPCAAFGLFCLTLAADMVAAHRFGVGFFLVRNNPDPSLGATIAAVAFLLLLAFGFMNCWVHRHRLVFIPDQFVVYELDWLGGTLRRRVPLADVAGIEVKALPGRHTAWAVRIRLSSGGWLHIQETREDEAQAVAERISWRLGLPLFHE